MDKSYRGSIFLSVFLKIIGVVVMLGGIGVTLWQFVASEGGLSRVEVIVYIGGSVVAGLVVYSLGELISLVLDVSIDLREKSKS